jgi:regulatory protein
VRQRPSLQARALQLLAQREQSRVELRRKLLRHAARDPDADPAASEVAVDAVLDWLEANRYLSAERFVESRVQARRERFGNLRIRAELAQHRMTLPDGAARELADSEARRAAEVRERRFGALPEEPAGRAAQARFLLQRGFSPTVVHRLLRRGD